MVLTTLAASSTGRKKVGAYSRYRQFIMTLLHTLTGITALVSVTKQIALSIHHSLHLYIRRQTFVVELVVQACHLNRMTLSMASICCQTVWLSLLPEPPEPVQLSMMQEEQRICKSMSVAFMNVDGCSLP